MHDSDEGEEVSILLSLEEVSNVDVAMEQLGPLQCVPSSDHSQGHSLRQVQVSEGGREKLGLVASN